MGGNLVLLALVGVAVNKLVFKGERSAFIMEMPLYHVPNARTIGLYVWRNTLAFIKKAGTLIVIVSAIVWVLSNYPGRRPQRQRAGRTSAGAWSPLGALMGLGDWRLIVALLSSFVAKENSVATLGVLFGGSAAAGAAAGAGLAAKVAAVLDPGRRRRLPGGADDLRALRGHRGRHQAGVALLALDRGQPRPDAGGGLRPGHRRLSGGLAVLAGRRLRCSAVAR